MYGVNDGRFWVKGASLQIYFCMSTTHPTTLLQFFSLIKVFLRLISAKLEVLTCFVERTHSFFHHRWAIMSMSLTVRGKITTSTAAALLTTTFTQKDAHVCLSSGGCLPISNTGSQIWCCWECLELCIVDVWCWMTQICCLLWVWVLKYSVILLLWCSLSCSGSSPWWLWWQLWYTLWSDFACCLWLVLLILAVTIIIMICRWVVLGRGTANWCFRIELLLLFENLFEVRYVHAREWSSAW